MAKIGIPTITKTETTTIKKRKAMETQNSATVTVTETETTEVDISNGNISNFHGQDDEIVVITPDHAEKLLSKMYWKMRPLTKSQYGKYERFMLTNYWMNNMTICIAVLDGEEHLGEGYLIDGQHRLRALVASNLTLSFNIKRYRCATREVINDLYQVIDQNKPKTSLDVLVSSGAGDKLELKIGQVSRAHSSIKQIYRKFDQNKKLDEDSEGWAFINNQLLKPYIFMDVWGTPIRNYYDAISYAIREMTCPTGNLNRSLIIAFGLITFRPELSSDYAYRFWKGIGNSQELDEDDPRLAASRYLMCTNMKHNATNVPLYEHIRVLIACWNAWAQGRKMSRAKKVNKPIRVYGFDYEL